MVSMAVIFFMNSTRIAIGQPSEQDCPGALPICSDTTVYGGYMGTGFFQDISNSNTTCLVENEENNVWLKFTASDTGLVLFQIIPSVINDDFDWALYEFVEDSCALTLLDTSNQVRCNYSAIPGSTGCDTPYTNVSSNAGQANQCATHKCSSRTRICNAYQ
jgi:hypothetical protein